MRIALDAAAGDTGLAPNIEGAIAAANAWGLELLLVGPAADLRSELTARGIPHSDRRFEVVDAPQVIPMDADPAAACRRVLRGSNSHRAGSAGALRSSKSA